MADSFKIQYSGKVTPVEEVESADGGKIRIVHSNIDKVLGGSNEVNFSSTSSKVNYKDYTTTTSGVNLEDSTIFNDANIQLDFWYMGIREAAGSGIPDVNVGVSGVSAAFIELQGIGDFLIIPFKNNNFPGHAITLNSTSSSTLAKVDILIGEIE
tara:strand:+ start:150 stop:614 length:465 start_codon:yes stop_codon:yes gene_type:complete